MSKFTEKEVNVLLNSLPEDLGLPSPEEWRKIVQSCIEKLPLKLNPLPNTKNELDIAKIDIPDSDDISKFPLFSFSKSWEEKQPIPGTPYHLQGHSRAAERTSFYCPELKVMFDAGLSSNVSPRLFAITHCHADHCCQAPMILMNWIPKDKKSILATQ